MKLYVGMDLHSTNVVIQMINEADKIIYRKKQSCDLDSILKRLESFQSEIEGIAVESTFNWYWLVDGLMDANYKVHLVNTAAVKQYEGLKHTDDDSDALACSFATARDIANRLYLPKTDPVCTRLVT